jgi:hypothetical protein
MTNVLVCTFRVGCGKCGYAVGDQHSCKKLQAAEKNCDCGYALAEQHLFKQLADLKLRTAEKIAIADILLLSHIS